MIQILFKPWGQQISRLKSTFRQSFLRVKTCDIFENKKSTPSKSSIPPNEEYYVNECKSRHEPNQLQECSTRYVLLRKKHKL